MSLLWIAALLYFLAVLLAFVDLFVPSGGALMVLGAMSGVASVVFAFQHGPMAGSVVLLVALASIPVFGFLAVRVWPNTPIGRRVIMKPRERSSEQNAASQKQREEIASMIGTVFTADADLMPSGTVCVQGKSLNAVAESGFVEAGQTCEIVNYRERQYVVRPTRQSVSPETGCLAQVAADLDQPTEVPSELGPSQPEAKTNLDESEQSLLDIPVEQFDLDSIDGEDVDRDS